MPDKDTNSYGPIFEDEFNMIRESEKLINEAGASNEEMQAGFKQLLDQYKSLLTKTGKLIKTSDSNQRKLKKVQNELEERNQRINHQNDELKKLNATKDKFFAIIAHDLKNPLSSFMSSSGLLSYHFSRLDEEEKLNLANSIYESGKRLRTLLENLLEWSMTQTGGMTVTPKELPLNELVNSNISLFELRANDKKIRLENKIQENINIFADENMALSVIRNLISNAIKFTPEKGNIYINAEVKNNFAEISVIDNGVGIKDEVMKKLFRLEDKHSSEGTNKEKGTGLGLILCKEFVEKNGGDIKVKSKENEGTKITFTLPVYS